MLILLKYFAIFFAVSNIIRIFVMQERGKHKAFNLTSVVYMMRYKKNLLTLVRLTGSRKGIT